MNPGRIIAVDWSGDASLSGQRKHIWIADLQGDRVELHAGKTREQVCAWLIGEAAKTPSMVVGLDFAFSFPQSLFESRGFTAVEDLWHAASDHGEDWLRACEAPFWGRPAKKCPDTHHAEGFRVTERTISVKGIVPKSPFQIGGAGAVGTGSIRGQATLAGLRSAGFSVWPFHPAAYPLVVEIYPRLLTGPVHKSRAEARLGYLKRPEFSELSDVIRKQAASSEDAFDALVSSVKMQQNAACFASLRLASDSRELLEGCIWQPLA